MAMGAAILDQKMETVCEGLQSKNQDWTSAGFTEESLVPLCEREINVDFYLRHH